ICRARKPASLEAETIMHVNMTPGKDGSRCRTDDLAILADLFVNSNILQGNLVAGWYVLLYFQILFLLNTSDLHDIPRLQRHNGRGSLINVSNLNRSFIGQAYLPVRIVMYSMPQRIVDYRISEGSHTDIPGIRMTRIRVT